MLSPHSPSAQRKAPFIEVFFLKEDNYKVGSKKDCLVKVKTIRLMIGQRRGMGPRLMVGCRLSCCYTLVNDDRTCSFFMNIYLSYLCQLYCRCEYIARREVARNLRAH